MLKRFIFTALSIAALSCSASAANAFPAASSGQTFYVSTSLSDTAGQSADPTIYNIGGNTYFKLRDLGRLLDFRCYIMTKQRILSILIQMPLTSPEPGESSTTQNTATGPRFRCCDESGAVFRWSSYYSNRL